MKNPYDPNKANSVRVYGISDSIPYTELYDGSLVDNINVTVRVNKTTWELYAEYMLLHSEKGLIPIGEVMLCKIHDPLIAFQLAGGYDTSKFDKDEYLKGLEEYMFLQSFPDFELPVLDYIKNPECLHRKMFRDDVNAYINYLASDGEGHYLTDYWMLRWKNQLMNLKGHLSIYNDTLLDNGMIKKKGVMKRWRKETL